MAIQYRQYIRQLLSERVQRAASQRNAQEYEVQTIFDSERDHEPAVRQFTGFGTGEIDIIESEKIKV